MQRARWKIDNETFNTLKNQGYQFGHNFGLSKQHLGEAFVLLMMLAFLVNQIQQLCCPLFKAVWKRWKTKRSLWEKVRSKFPVAAPSGTGTVGKCFLFVWILNENTIKSTDS
jgi:hypothetical protein